MTKRRVKKKSKKPVKELSELDKYVIKQVKKIREDRGFTQEQLSLALDLSNTFIGQIESVKTPAHYNIQHLNRIAKILKCSLHDIFPKDPI
jgi:transcriptional regulator with XRE-family HTH domain